MRSSIGLEKAVRIPNSPQLTRCHRSDPLLNTPAYGFVARARDTRTSQIVALKQIRMDARERYSGIPITALREIGILRSTRHQNVVKVIDVAVGGSSKRKDDEDVSDEGRAGLTRDEIYMVMEYAEQVGVFHPSLLSGG